MRRPPIRLRVGVVSKVDDHRRELRAVADREPYLLERSGLPGPRANLELAWAAAEEADAATLRRWAALGPCEAPSATGEEFLAVCGVIGLGRLAAAGDSALLTDLRRHAGDPRWRVREAVAMALQCYGDTDLPALLGEMRAWAGGTALERRAAVAALCEPRLLSDRAHVCRVLALLDRITRALPDLPDRRGADFRALRKTLGYGWSVAVAALPDEGRPLFERLLGSDDRDIRWVTRENLRKKRLERMDAAWTERARARA
jgi:hypothetical protein